MSDAPQGPGWWQASDGKWYPPEQAPGGGQQPPPGGGQPQPQPAGAGGVSVGDAFNYGWNKFQKNFQPFILIGLALFAAMAVLFIVWWLAIYGTIGTTTTTIDETGISQSGGGFFGLLIANFVLVLLTAAIQMVVSLAFIRAALAVVRGEPIEMNKLTSTEGIGPFILGAILVAIGTGIGTLLCYLPGLIFYFFAQFWGFFVVDKKMAPVDAIKASFDLVNRNLGTVVVFYIGVVITMAIGYLLCGVGILAAFPIVMIATAYMFKRLQGEEVAPVVA